MNAANRTERQRPELAESLSLNAALLAQATEMVRSLRCRRRMLLAQLAASQVTNKEAKLSAIVDTFSADRRRRPRSTRARWRVRPDPMRG